jgi:hypothetical protein
MIHYLSKRGWMTLWLYKNYWVEIICAGYSNVGFILRAAQLVRVPLVVNIRVRRVSGPLVTIGVR